MWRLSIFSLINSSKVPYQIMLQSFTITNLSTILISFSCLALLHPHPPYSLTTIHTGNKVSHSATHPPSLLSGAVLAQELFLPSPISIMVRSIEKLGKETSSKKTTKKPQKVHPQRDESDAVLSQAGGVIGDRATKPRQNASQRLGRNQTTMNSTNMHDHYQSFPPMGSRYNTPEPPVQSEALSAPVISPGSTPSDKPKKVEQQLFWWK